MSAVGIVRFEPTEEGGTRVDITPSYNPPAVRATARVISTAVAPPTTEAQHADRRDRDLDRGKERVGRLFEIELTERIPHLVPDGNAGHGGLGLTVRRAEQQPCHACGNVGCVVFVGGPVEG